MLRDFLEHYGYLALFIGTFLEGETIVILAGIAVSEGLLDIRWTILSAFMGSVSGDQLYFFIGRWKGDWLLKTVPRWRAPIQKVLAILERHCVPLILLFRFMYGLRNVTSFAIGMSRVRAWLFVVLNFTGALIWAISFAYGGYLFGAALLTIIKDVESHEKHVLGGACVVAVAAWVYRLLRRRKDCPPATKETPPGGPPLAS